MEGVPPLPCRGGAAPCFPPSLFSLLPLSYYAAHLHSQPPAWDCALPPLRTMRLRRLSGSFFSTSAVTGLGGGRERGVCNRGGARTGYCGAPLTRHLHICTARCAHPQRLRLSDVVRKRRFKGTKRKRQRSEHRSQACAAVRRDAVCVCVCVCVCSCCEGGEARSRPSVCPSQFLSLPSFSATQVGRSVALFHTSAKRQLKKETEVRRGVSHRCFGGTLPAPPSPRVLP